ncbi:MAG: RNA 2',3'-cyclic phosphodiesterase [Candidatus Micrarchaeota archaeon]
MRLFVAVPIPVELRNKLGEKSEELTQDGIRLVDPKNMHITLRFLGEVPDEKEIVEKLRRVKFEKISCTMKGVGAFPNQNHVKVIWAGIESKEKLENLAAKVNAALEGFPGDERFSAHITIARVRKRIDLKNFIEKNCGEFGKFEVDSFELIKSTLLPQGPEYSVVEKFHADDIDA